MAFVPFLKTKKPSNKNPKAPNTKLEAISKQRETRNQENKQASQQASKQLTTPTGNKRTKKLDSKKQDARSQKPATRIQNLEVRSQRLQATINGPLIGFTEPFMAINVQFVLFNN